MFNFLTEHLGSIVTGLVVLGVVIAIVLHLKRAKRQGKHPGCGCGCAECPSSAACGGR